MVVLAGFIGDKLKVEFELDNVHLFEKETGKELFYAEL